jgi:hypothetical protein
VRLPGIQIWWFEGVDAELRGVLALEGVVLVRVAAGDEDAAVGEEVGGGVVEPGDGGGGEGLEPGCGVVCGVGDGVEDGVGGLAPSLGSVPGAVDEQDVRRREEDHVAHGAPDGHRLHAPLRVGSRRDDATAGARRWPCAAIRASERPEPRAAADQHLGHREIVFILQRQHHRGSGGRVVPGLAGNGRVGLHNAVVDVVQQDGVPVREHEQVAVRHEVQERVHVIVLPVALRKLKV